MKKFKFIAFIIAVMTTMPILQSCLVMMTPHPIHCHQHHQSDQPG